MDTLFAKIDYHNYYFSSVWKIPIFIKFHSDKIQETLLLFAFWMTIDNILWLKIQLPLILLAYSQIQIS